MCGIAGLINFDNSYQNTIKKSLYHRGPDGEGQFLFEIVLEYQFE